MRRWINLGAGASRCNLVVAGLLPVAGLVAVLTYRWWSRDVRFLPYLPFALAAVVYGISMVDLAVAVARHPDGAFIPIVQYGIGFLLPFIAFVCGLAGFTLVKPTPTP